MARHHGEPQLPQLSVQVHVPGVTIVAADDHIVHPPNGSLLVARSQYIHREEPGCQCSVQCAEMPSSRVPVPDQHSASKMRKGHGFIGSASSLYLS